MWTGDKTRFSVNDADRLSDILAEAAAAEVMPRFRDLGNAGVRAKAAPFDVVTDADEAAERVISAALLKEHPGAMIVGEEAAEKNPALLAGLADADLAFIVDPVDGTRNFASGLPLFSVMAAVVRRGEVVAGVIHDPIVGDWAVTLRGEGAWTRRGDGTRFDLHVAQPAPLSRMEGIFGSTAHLPEPMKSTVCRNLVRPANALSFRCFAHEYRLAAGGHCHFLLFNFLMPWDHAAGWLLHREAGGYSAHFDGSSYLPSHTKGGIICAPDEASWREVRDGMLR